MKKSLRIVLLVLAIVIAALWLARPTPSPTRDSGERMKAIVYHDYGPPDVLQLADIPKPLPNDHQVLIKVRAAAANPLDWHYLRGTPYLIRIVESGWFKPVDPLLGADVAGQVVAVGKRVTHFKPGDAVFGTGGGAFAEYVLASEEKVVLKPAGITFEQAAAVPIAALTALQGLRDNGHIQPGQKVLINGSSGGVGTFAVQLAKFFGAHVTAVCSTRNVDLVQSLGADRVIDYSKENFTADSQRYDLILDNVGNHSLLAFRRVLNPEGIYIGIGGGAPGDAGLLGPMWRPIRSMLLAPFVSQELGTFVASVNRKDLTFLKELLETGQLAPVIDRTYSLSETAAAIRYLEQGRARGKIVITPDPAP
jgi:NADPH:quinone reductase-like Zn-dependent oxidoreductase